MFAKDKGNAKDGKGTVKLTKKHSTMKRGLLSQMSARTLGSGNMKAAVVLPAGEERCEWIAANTVDFFNELTLLYGLVSEQAQDKYNKPGEGFPSGFEYRWADGGGKPVRVSSPEYVDYVLSWIEAQIDDPSIFPVNESEPFPENFEVAYIRDIFKRMFRCFAIIYHRHFEKIQELDATAHLNTCFKHFVYFSFEFELLEEQETQVMKPHVEKFKDEFSKE